MAEKKAKGWKYLAKEGADMMGGDTDRSRQSPSHRHRS